MRPEIKAALMLGLLGIIGSVIWGVIAPPRSAVACEACGGTGRVAVVEEGP